MRKEGVSFDETPKFAAKEHNFILKQGVPLTDYFPIDKFHWFINITRDAIKGFNIKYEISYNQPDKTTSWYGVKLASITDEANIIGMMMSINDITVSKKTKQDLSFAYTIIEKQDSNMQKIAWMHSHLIRRPLANLKALLGMLNENPLDTRVLDYIHSELERMDASILETGRYD